MKTFVGAMISLALLTMTAPVSADETPPCAQTVLSGRYACSFEGQPLTITVERKGDQITLATQLAGSREDRESYVADGVRRVSASGTGRIDEYAATCRQKSIRIEYFVGDEPVARSALTLERVPNGMVWNMVRDDGTVRLNCTRNRGRS